MRKSHAASVCALLFLTSATQTSKVTRKQERRLDLTEAVEAIRPAIVQIRFSARGFPPELRERLGVYSYDGPLGTGFIVNLEGYVITANHVITEGRTLLDQIQADRKRMLVGIPIANVNTEHLVVRGSYSAQEFDVVDVDEHHDLALLKVKGNKFNVAQPVEGAGSGGIPASKVAAAVLDPERPQDGAAVAISGYPLGKTVLVTNGGWMASVWPLDLIEVHPPGTPDWFKTTETADSYLAAVNSNRGNSGGPAYLVYSGAVIGICVRVEPAPVRDQTGRDMAVNGHALLYSSGLTTIVPAEYIIKLLKKNNVSWSTVPPFR